MFKSKHLLFITADNTFRINEIVLLLTNSFSTWLFAQGRLYLMRQMLNKF